MSYAAAVTELSVTLTLLFFPGVICVLLVERLVPTREWSSFRFPLYSFVLGVGCYLLYSLIAAALQWSWPPDVSFVKALLERGDSKALATFASAGLIVMRSFM